MSATFDPYYKWLGIPPQDQPADHYRLLGLTHFESDPQVIESAADRQMVHLRTFATGPQGALSQKLLNEVAAARVCLLNEAKKNAYDESLRARLAATAQATAAAELPAAMPVSFAPQSVMQAVEIPMVEVPVIAAAKRPLAGARKSRRPAWQHPAILSAAATLVILVIAVAFAFRKDEKQLAGGPSKPPAEVTPRPAPPNQATVQQTSNSSLGQANDSNPATATNGGTTLAPQPAGGGNGDLVQHGNRSSTGNSTDSSGNSDSTTSATNNGSEETDLASAEMDRPAYVPGRRLGLLRSIDLLRHRVEGDWQRVDGQLFVAQGKARMRLPFRPRSQPYELLIQARRDSGNDALMVGLAFQGREFLVLLDRGGTTLLSNVDGQRQASDAQWQRSIFTPGQFADIVITVREEGLSIVANNQSLANWTAYDRLSANPDWSEGQGMLLIASNNSAFTISKIIATPLAPAAPSKVAGNNSTPPTTTTAGNTTTATSQSQAASGGRQPVPSEAALAKAEATFKQAFDDKLKQASRAADKAMLARELANRARTATSDPADHYVLLTQARQLAADAGEVALALELVAELERHFESDYWQSRLDALSAATSNASTFEARQAVMSTTLELAEQAAKQDKFEHAADLSALAATAASALKDSDQVRAARERQSEYKSRQRQWEVASQARDKLAESPDDASANLIWGKYVCLVRGDWKAGLAFLSKGSDTRLRDAAAQELAADNSAEARAKTGDSWFAVNEPNKTEKLAYLNRAKQWYEQAAPQLAMPERSRVEKRIGEINEQLHRLTGGKGRAAFPLTGMVGRVMVGGKDANLVIHYQPTKGFNSEAFKELLTKHNIKGNGIRIELAGAMRLPADTWSHAFVGGKGLAMLNQLYIDGPEKHFVDASGKEGKYGESYLLQAGDYYIRWVLAGNTIEDCSMGIESTMQNFQPLPIVHTPDMLNKLKPHRAKEEVDVSRN